MLGLDSQSGTAETGLPVQDSRDSSAGQDCREPGQDIRDRIAGTEQPGQDSQKRTASTGQSGQDSWYRPSEQNS
jgi:hypothetical protein